MRHDRPWSVRSRDPNRGDLQLIQWENRRIDQQEGREAVKPPSGPARVCTIHIVQPTSPAGPSHAIGGRGTWHPQLMETNHTKPLEVMTFLT